MNKGILLDSNILIALADSSDKHHIKAKEFMEYVLSIESNLFYSVINICEVLSMHAVREYTSKMNLVSFEYKHALLANKLTENHYRRYHINPDYIKIKEEAKKGNNFIKTVFDIAKSACTDDIKLLSQCHVEPAITTFVSFDSRLFNEFTEFKNATLCKFDFIDLNTTSMETIRYSLSDGNIFDSPN